MQTRLIVPIILGAFVASVPALAADAPDAKCVTLQRQFDEGIYPFHIASNPTTVEAKTMRDEGVNLCTSGNATEGAAKIRNALEKLGVTPHA